MMLMVTTQGARAFRKDKNVIANQASDFESSKDDLGIAAADSSIWIPSIALPQRRVNHVKPSSRTLLVANQHQLVDSDYLADVTEESKHQRNVPPPVQRARTSGIPMQKQSMGRATDYDEPPFRTRVPTAGNTSWQHGMQTSRHAAEGITKLNLHTAAVVVPHPSKLHRRYALPPSCGGEDAFFIDEAAGLMGVADGVGGWVTQDVDPGIFSRELMHYAAESVKAGMSDPGSVLTKAHSQTKAEGSATALIVQFEDTGIHDGSDTPSGLVRAANLGDSGFMHLRRGDVLFQSHPMQHHFNVPYQLAAPHLRDGGNTPADSELIVLNNVAKGDVLVLGTDGLSPYTSPIRFS
jgi:hypothetical protein